MENKYLFADKKVHVTFSYPYIKNHCVGYETDGECDYDITITEQDIAYEREGATEGNFGDGYLEFLAFYRLFCTRAALDNIILFHSFACEVDGKAYLFTAKSGTGKTTHGMLWQKVLGSRMRVINGDKPLIKVDGDDIIVYGTPWNGKERLGENGYANIHAICLIERGVENQIECVSWKEAFPRLYVQTFRPDNEESLVRVISNVTRISKRIPIYKLKCNISEEAAKLSYETMSEGLL